MCGGLYTLRFDELILRCLIWGTFVLCVPALFLLLVDPGFFVRDRVEQFLRKADRVEVLSLGSSHSRGLYFPSMGFTGYSFADDRGDISTAVYKSNLILPHARHLKYVMIPASPGYFSYDRRAAFGSFDPDLSLAIRNAPWPKNFWSLSLDEQYLLVRSNIFAFETLLSANGLAKDALGHGIRLVLGRSQKSFRNPCRARTNQTSFPHEFGILNGFTREAIPARCLPRIGQFEARLHARTVRAVLAANSVARETNTRLLNELAVALAARKAQLILFVPPLTRSYLGKALRRLWEEEKPYREDLLKLPNVRLFDFHDLFAPSSYTKDNRYFSDGSHLTLAGAQALSKVFGQVMRQSKKRVSTADVGAYLTNTGKR